MSKLKRFFSRIGLKLGILEQRPINNMEVSNMAKQKQRQVRFKTKVEPAELVKHTPIDKVLARKGRQKRLVYTNKDGEVMQSKNGAQVQKVGVKVEARGAPDRVTIQREPELTPGERRRMLLAQRRAYTPISGRFGRITPKMPRIS